MMLTTIDDHSSLVTADVGSLSLLPSHPPVSLPQRSIKSDDQGLGDILLTSLLPIGFYTSHRRGLLAGFISDSYQVQGQGVKPNQFATHVAYLIDTLTIHEGGNQTTTMTTSPVCAR